MTTPYLTADISWDEAPNGQPILHAYPDPLTKGPPWTIGLGSTGPDIKPDTEWTAEQCYARRDSDVAKLIEQCSHFPWWENANDARQDVFVQMGYQMGFDGLLKFTASLAAAARGAWETVSADLKLSLWDHQTHTRAERLAEQARTGVRLPRSYDAEIVPVQPAPQPKESTVSFLSTFVFNPILAEIARGFTSSSPTTQATAAAASTAAATVVQPTATTPAAASSNSPLGSANDIIAQLENDLNNAVAAFVQATVAAEVPVVGVLVAPRVGELTKVALTFAENHALTYVSALFNFHKTVSVPAALPQAPAGS